MNFHQFFINTLHIFSFIQQHARIMYFSMRNGVKYVRLCEKIELFSEQKNNDIIKTIRHSTMNIFNEVLAFNNMFENEKVLDRLVIEERKRRILVEGPPDANFHIVTELGSLYKVRENGRIWDINHPCKNCNENECFSQLVELAETPPVKYVYDDIASNCKNPKNNALLTMLCNWRKHVKDTFIIQLPEGSDKWKKRSVCTSELTFLGRKTGIGGIIGIVSLTNKHICSLGSLVSLMDKEEGVHNGVKCLSAGFALLITMYIGWDLYTEENKNIIGRLLKKIKKNGVTGLETYSGSPWYAMFKCILERRTIPDKLKECILSRAHLP